MNEKDWIAVESTSNVFQFFFGLGLAILLSISGCCLPLWHELNIRAPRFEPSGFLFIEALIAMGFFVYGIRSGKFQMLIGFVIGFAAVWLVFYTVCDLTPI